MHLATLMHSNHVTCIIGVSKGVRFVKGGEISSNGASRPPSPPFNETLHIPALPPFALIPKSSFYTFHHVKVVFFAPVINKEAKSESTIGRFERNWSYKPREKHNLHRPFTLFHDCSTQGRTRPVIIGGAELVM